MKNDYTSDLTTLVEAFERLSNVDDPVKFHIQFEREQKASGLRVSTFKAAFRAWQAQQNKEGTAL
jgi:hypothetical protein